MSCSDDPFDLCLSFNDSVHATLNQMTNDTCSEHGGNRVAADVPAPGDERHLVLSVWSQAPDAVLFVRGEQLHAGFVGGVGAGPINQRDPVHGGHRLRPADQSRRVRHVLNLHMLGGVDLWRRGGGIQMSQLHGILRERKDALCYIKCKL